MRQETAALRDFNSPMSALCQKRTFAASFDHLVGAGKQTIQDMEHIATVAMKWELPSTILDFILTSAE
jgi:hypothetical protein